MWENILATLQNIQTWENFLTALGIMLLLEGIPLLLYPKKWKKMLEEQIAEKDLNLRIIGLTTIVISTGMIYVSHNFF